MSKAKHCSSGQKTHRLQLVRVRVRVRANPLLETEHPQVHLVRGEGRARG